MNDLTAIKNLDTRNILTELDRMDLTLIENLPEITDGVNKEYLTVIKSMYEVLSQIKNQIINIENQEEKIFFTYQERADSMNSIAHANEEITNGVKSQTESTEKCAELASVFQDHFESMLQSFGILAQKARETGEVCTFSEKSIQDLLDVSKKSQEKFLNIADHVSILAKNAEHINSIIGVIIRVARETNLLSINVDVPQSRRNVFITSDSYEGGKIAGEAAAVQLKGTGNIIAMLCAAAVPTVQQRYKGFLDAVSKYPGIKIIKKVEQNDTDMNQTRRILEDLTNMSAIFDLLYMVNSDAGEIAVDIFRKKRLDKKLLILSKSNKITEGICDGIVSSQIVQRNSLWGELAVLYIDRMLMKESVMPYEDTGMYEINKSNLLVFETYGK